MTRRAAARPRKSKRPTRDSYHHGDLSRALVAVALELVEAHGVEDFSLREATTRCGVAVSSAYKHFPTRGALLDAVADLGFVALGEDMDARVAKASKGLEGVPRAEAALVAIGRSYVLFALARPRLFKLMYGPSGARASLREGGPARALGAKLVGGIDGVLRARGGDRSKLEMHMMIAWSLVHGFSMLALDGLWPSQGQALDARIAELGSAVLRSLR